LRQHRQAALNLALPPFPVFSLVSGPAEAHTTLLLLHSNRTGRQDDVDGRSTRAHTPVLLLSSFTEAFTSTGRPQQAGRCDVTGGKIKTRKRTNLSSLFNSAAAAAAAAAAAVSSQQPRWEDLVIPGIEH